MSVGCCCDSHADYCVLMFLKQWNPLYNACTFLVAVLLKRCMYITSHIASIVYQHGHPHEHGHDNACGLEQDHES